MIVIPNQVSRLLKDKITLVKLPEGPDLALVGPVRLPVQLEEREITFNWYTWLRTESASFEVEDVLHILPFADLASYQQSSVLVYGDFANVDSDAQHLPYRGHLWKQTMRLRVPAAPIHEHDRRQRQRSSLLFGQSRRTRNRAFIQIVGLSAAGRGIRYGRSQSRFGLSG